jgi:5-methylcytosine-specific restriction endonuclease McrA
MGLAHYAARANGVSRQRLLAGDTPAWIANNKRARYIVSVVLSAPPWVDRKALLAMNAQAALLTKCTGILHVMDHIVPLNHPRVCGLTVPWNMQIITWRQNAAKSNRWCPEQMELFPNQTESTP